MYRFQLKYHKNAKGILTIKMYYSIKYQMIQRFLLYLNPMTIFLDDIVNKIGYGMKIKFQFISIENYTAMA